MAAFLLHQLLDQSAQRYPERPALADSGRVLTYGELDAWSSRIAWALLEHGVRRGDRVGIYLDKSAAAVAGIYGALKAGACYVPCDPAAPVARIAAMMRDCEMRVVCAGPRQATLLPDVIGSDSPIRHVMILNEEHQDTADPVTEIAGRTVTTPGSITSGSDRPPGVAGSELDLAYILYTSGSTGQPKGVMLTHRNGLSFVEWAVGELGVGPEDRLSSHAPFQFDLSVLDLFGAAAGGASTWLVPSSASVFPPHLARFVRDSRITIWYSVPSVLSTLIQRGGIQQNDFPELRAMLFAGEVFPTRFLRRLVQLLPHARFGNLYGPTETNVCTAYWISGPPESDRDIPIGSAIGNVETFLVRADASPSAPTSAPALARTGELCVRGPTVARGYWGDPQRTKERFVRDPRGGPGADMVYRTGDLVQLLDDGNYLFLGRLDSQIKSRGHRVELGEIETALRLHHGVVDAAAVATPHALMTNLIKVCVVVDPGIDERELRQHCQSLLPRYMIPDIIEIRRELPRTPTGKLDRQALAGTTGATITDTGRLHDDR